MQFLEYFRNIIEKKIEKDLIIDMALTESMCKDMIFDYFCNKSIELRHFILVASKKDNNFSY